ncbi:methyltransferase [Planktomarina sp.]|jgi:demethylspheroidene O-methyltransferase|uniref:methyltransferase n=1 Tax=Planktomarina TaxID=1284657 RepID=UPI0032618640
MPGEREAGGWYGISGWSNRLIASRKFQKWAAKSFLTRRMVRREGAALFGLLAGFCHSQVLMALVQFDIFNLLLNGPKTLEELAETCKVPQDRMTILLRAAVALKLLRSKGGGRFALSKTSAALLGVPGLSDMIRHHDVLYRDLSDPAAFFRGDTQTELADFWPYVFGGEMEPQAAKTYSDLMARSQELVAEDTLRSLDLSTVGTLLDVGGGSGAFLEHVGRAHPHVKLMLFDLEQVAPTAAPRFAAAGMDDRAQIACGSFKTDAIPKGADSISLIRVLYDHTDETVAMLLAKCWASLPLGGRLIISEPMSGGACPEPAGDVYFALYTLAMRTGKTRSIQEISTLCRQAGFDIIKTPKPARAFVTRCLEARKVASAPAVNIS